jgi:hypothetical protein
VSFYAVAVDARWLPVLSVPESWIVATIVRIDVINALRHNSTSIIKVQLAYLIIRQTKIMF